MKPDYAPQFRRTYHAGNPQATRVKDYALWIKILASVLGTFGFVGALLILVVQFFGPLVHP